MAETNTELNPQIYQLIADVDFAAELASDSEDVKSNQTRETSLWEDKLVYKNISDIDFDTVWFGFVPPLSSRFAIQMQAKFREFGLESNDSNIGLGFTSWNDEYFRFFVINPNGDFYIYCDDKEQRTEVSEGWQNSTLKHLQNTHFTLQIEVVYANGRTFAPGSPCTIHYWLNNQIVWTEEHTTLPYLPDWIGVQTSPLTQIEVDNLRLYAA
jgi:hypothetical protein